MPAPPALTAEQRRKAYEHSLAVRRLRADFKRWLAERPELAVERLTLSLSSEAEVAKGMRVYDLLRALPGVGQARAEAILEASGVKGRRNTVAMLGDRQRDKLLEILNSKKPRS